MDSCKHVLILGCGRSGTSIFGELFQHLPTYHYYSEPSFKEVLELDAVQQNVVQLTTSVTGVAQSIAVKVPRESEGFPPDTGLSFPLSTLTEILFPLQIFWQVRHPLDTICSLKVGISRNWGHHPQPPDWQQWLSRPLIERCAHHWNYINSVGFAQVKNAAVITRFEDMLANPLEFAQSVGKMIHLDIGDNEQPLRQWAERVQDKPNEKFVEAETSRAYSTQDHSVKVGRWQENLNEEEIQLALPIIQETAQALGYNI